MKIKTLNLKEGVCSTCKFLNEWYENHEFGYAERMAECENSAAYDLLDSDDDVGTDRCPCPYWERLDTKICGKHGLEYFDICPGCENDFIEEEMRWGEEHDGR